MKRKRIVSLTLLLCLTIIFSVVSISYSQGAWNQLCTLFPAPAMPTTPLMPDVGRGSYEVGVITRLYNRQPIPVFIEYGINNAMAFTGGPYNGAFIMYDPDLLNRVAAQYGSGASLAILAHEAGHIIVGIRIPGNIPDWSDEARADYFAGYTLARLGVTPRPIVQWLQWEASQPDYRHPDGYTRAVIVEQGYIAGGGSSWNL